jgi:sulfatase modifying factor 1
VAKRRTQSPRSARPGRRPRSPHPATATTPTPPPVSEVLAYATPLPTRSPFAEGDDAPPESVPSSARPYASDVDLTPPASSVSPVARVARSAGIEHTSLGDHSVAELLREHPRWRFFAAVTLMVMVALVTRERSSLRRALSELRTTVAAGLTNLRDRLPGRTAEPTPAKSSIAAATHTPCPEEMSLVERDDVRVCVDKWEASVVEIEASGAEKPHSPYEPVDGLHVRAISREGVPPQGYISRDQAELACTEAGKRLCAPAEWQTACQGPDQTKYPYGETAEPKACNAHGRAPLGALFGGYGSDVYDKHIMNDPSLNALDGTLAKTGEFAECTNGFGLYDMVGNLHEWTSERRGVFRGGYYLDTTLNGEGCHYATTAHFASYHDYSTGFRCCKDPE